MAPYDAKEPLMSREIDSLDLQDHESLIKLLSPTQRRIKALNKTFSYIFTALPWALLGLVALWSQRSLHQCQAKYYIRPDLTYSPLQDLVQYETKVFTTGHPGDGEPSLYAGEPSDEVDELWKALYPSLHQLISKEEAMKLPNHTVLFPHDEERRYVIELDVFHQLHCLNMVRKATRPDYYKQHVFDGEAQDRLLGREHIAHCIDIIRQSLMCASDITVYTWSWDEKLGTNKNQVRNAHVCRNFDALREWSRINTKQVAFDFDYREPNDPLDPSTWIEGYTGA